MKKAMVFGLLALLVAGMAFNAGPASAAETFTVGWQPYYIDSFSPAVIQELELLEKYLPGVTVKFQEAYTLPFIVAGYWRAGSRWATGR